MSFPNPYWVITIDRYMLTKKKNVQYNIRSILCVQEVRYRETENQPFKILSITVGGLPVCGK